MTQLAKATQSVAATRGTLAGIRGMLTEAGLGVTAFRALVSTSKVAPSDWVTSGIGKLLHFQPAPVRLETRYQVEHMSLAILRVPLPRPLVDLLVPLLNLQLLILVLVLQLRCLLLVLLLKGRQLPRPAPLREVELVLRVL